MKVVILVNADDPEYMEILCDSNGNRIVFDNHHDADMWLEDNAKQGRSYLRWDGSEQEE